MPTKTASIHKNSKSTSKTASRVGAQKRILKNAQENIQNDEKSTIKELTSEQRQALFAPLPIEALKPHPIKTFLTVIAPMYVLERLNDVFGVGKWEFRTEPVDTGPANGNRKMCVVKGIMDIPEYGIHLEQYGGNDNPDMGDAYKGAATDALTKIASYLGIGFDVYKGKKEVCFARDGEEREMMVIS